MNKLVPKSRYVVLKSGGKSVKITSSSDPAIRNRRRQQLLLESGVNVKVDGSWGPWQLDRWNTYTKKHPEMNRRVDFSKVTEQDNLGRAVPVLAINQLLDSLIGRYYPEPLRLAILATSLLEMDKRGAATVGKGGNGYLGLDKKRMSTSLLDDSPQGRGEQIYYILNDLENMHKDNWTSGNDEEPHVLTAKEGFDKFWGSKNNVNASIYLNKCYIRPRDGSAAWKNRARISNILKTKVKK